MCSMTNVVIEKKTSEVNLFILKHYFEFIISLSKRKRKNSTNTYFIFIK